MPLGEPSSEAVTQAFRALSKYDRLMHRAEFHSVMSLMDEFIRWANKHWSDGIRAAELADDDEAPSGARRFVPSAPHRNAAHASHRSDRHREDLRLPELRLRRLLQLELRFRQLRGAMQRRRNYRRAPSDSRAASPVRFLREACFPVSLNQVFGRRSGARFACAIRALFVVGESACRRRFSHLCRFLEGFATGNFFMINMWFRGTMEATEKARHASCRVAARARGDVH